MRFLPAASRHAAELTRRASAAAMLAALLSCASDGATGPEVAIDGSWEFVGVFDGREEPVRCWLSGEMTVMMIGTGANTMLGTGRHHLACEVSGEDVVVERTGAVENGRFQFEEVSMRIGLCTFGGTYRPRRANYMKGTAACNVGFTGVGQVGMLGSWEAHRRDAP